MSRYVYWSLNDEDDLQKVLDSKCKCGHELSEHGFTWTASLVPGKGALYVSQCVMCNNCKEFNPSGNQNVQKPRTNQSL